VDRWVSRDGGLVERSWKFREVSRRVPPAPAVEELVRSYTARIAHDLDVVVGRTAVAFEAHADKLWTAGSGAPNTDDHRSGGRLCAHGCAASKAAAARSTPASSRQRPAICSPTGRPVRVKPHGTEIAGRPTTVNA
jgi:hypothetical protein